MSCMKKKKKIMITIMKIIIIIIFFFFQTYCQPFYAKAQDHGIVSKIL